MKYLPSSQYLKQEMSGNTEGEGDKIRSVNVKLESVCFQVKSK